MLKMENISRSLFQALIYRNLDLETIKDDVGSLKVTVASAQQGRNALEPWDGLSNARGALNMQVVTNPTIVQGRKKLRCLLGLHGLITEPFTATS